jgi:hypothetical protein
LSRTTASGVSSARSYVLFSMSFKRGSNSGVMFGHRTLVTAMSRSVTRSAA